MTEMRTRSGKRGENGRWKGATTCDGCHAENEAAADDVPSLQMRVIPMTPDARHDGHGEDMRDRADCGRSAC